MLKASELRMGNEYQYADTKNNFTWCSHHFETELSQLNLYEPIPLTEEWMGKFGFITHDCEIDYVDWGFRHNDFHILQDGLDGVQPFYFEYEGANENRVEIKYVHQIQNLYFALTGEELTIKNQVDNWDSFYQPPTLNKINKELLNSDCNKTNGCSH